MGSGGSTESSGRATGADVVVPRAPFLLDTTGPFVGRVAELDALLARWTEAERGTVQALFIAGEPGIGKTRLAAELAARVATKGLVLYGRCHDDVTVPYQALLEVLKACVTACPPEVLRGISRVGELARLMPELTDAIPPVDHPTVADPGSERYLVFQAAADLIATTASIKPLLMVLDDLHWAAKPTILLLRHILRWPQPMALMVVGTYRSTDLDRTHPLAEALVDLRRDGLVSRVALAGLDRDGVRQYLESGGGQPLSAEVLDFADALVGETGGNPFFLKEVLAHLVDTGVVSQDGGQWAAHVEISELGLPEGVREVVSRRLARLSEATQRCLAAAAIVGSSFSVQLLARVLNASDESVLDAMDEAVAAGLIVEQGTRFAFAHALIRQTLDAELSSARKMRLHRLTAEAIEAGDDGPPNLEVLAFHFAEAALDGQVAKAADYALAAGEDAIARLAFEEAVALLERGLGVLELGEEPDRARRADLLCCLAGALEFAGEVTASKEAALRAADDARALGSADRLAQAAARYGAWLFTSSADPSMSRLSTEALAALGDRRPELRAVVLARYAAYRALVEHESDDGHRMALTALELARQLGDTAIEAEALDACAMTLLGTPRVKEQLFYLSQPAAQGTSHLGMAMRAVAYLALGDVAGFDAHTAELRSVATERRAWFGMALGTSLAAVRALLDGRFSDAAALVDETLALGAGDASIEAAYAGQLFALHRETGRLEDLLPLLEQAVVDNPIVVAFRVGLVLAKAATGDLDGARRGFEGLAADRFAAVPRDYAYVVSLAFLAETCAVLDDVARAGELYDLLRPHQGHLVLTGWGILCGGAVDRYLAMLLTVMGKWDEAGEAFARALALETELASPPLVARTKYWYARMLVDQAMPADGADRARGQAMVTDVEEASIALGMAGLAADARDLALQCEVPRAG